MEKLNIAELLKDCPKGMELDCTIFDNATFEEIRTCCSYPIKIITGACAEFLTEYGCISYKDTAKCVIFPKGKTTWEGFKKPFKDGDIVFYNDTIAIFKEWDNEISFRTYVTKYLCCDSLIDINTPLFGENIRKEIRFATEEERQKLFDAIKANGYKWNDETKTLEKLIKPKFKVGDRITDKKKFIYRITEITDKGYKLHDLKTTFITFEEADWYFVKVVDVFNIDTLIPFESRVLVRSSYGDIWRPAIYGVIDSEKHYHYVVGGNYWTQCIPFEPNKGLLGTTNDCDEYYKTWK